MMAIFDKHFIGAKNHNQDDLLWLVACYYGTMMDLCAEYSYWGDEDLFGLLLEWFWSDFERFKIRKDTKNSAHKDRKQKK